MGNIALRVGIKPEFLAFWDSVLTISPPKLPDIITQPTATCLSGSLPKRTMLLSCSHHYPPGDEFTPRLHHDLLLVHDVLLLSCLHNVVLLQLLQREGSRTVILYLYLNNIGFQ